MPYDEFYGAEEGHKTDWQQSSSPMTSRKVHKIAPDESTALIWPVDTPKDDLADGLHPVVAIGAKAHRPMNLTGVVIGYHADCEVAQINLAEKVIVRNYVTNILSYTTSNGGVPNSWVNTILAGQPVYVDDSTDLPAGATLSFSPLNEDAAMNPLAGYVFWCQDEYEDFCVGGPNSAQDIPQPAAENTTETLTLCVILTNDAYSYFSNPRQI